MAIELSVRLSPSARRFTGGIDELKAALRDLRKPFRTLVPVFGSEVARTIREEGAPIGERWPPHAPATRARYGGGGHAMLQRSGRLLRTVYKGGKRRVKKKRLQAGGPRKRYQFVQHFGSRRRNIPARPFIGITAEMTKATMAALDAHVQKAVALASSQIGGPR